MTEWRPTEVYRTVLKNGMYGWDVWAIQVALNDFNQNLVLDGVFGAGTERAALRVQATVGTKVDGIVGPQTQAAMCSVICAAIERGRVPAGLLKGVCYGESSGVVPSVTPPYPNGSRDYGCFQENLPFPSQGQLREAFDIQRSGVVSTERLEAAHRRYLGKPGARSQEEAWRLAVLEHNWPEAAEKIAAGEGETWSYVERGTGLKRHLKDPTPWVEAFHVNGVTTGWDWCKFYIDGKAVYVKSWTV